MKKDVKKYLENYGVKPSVQRLAIMDYLMTHRTHPTVDDIFNGLSDQIPTLSKTTVYNTIRLLAECGAILTLDIEPNNTHYDGDNTEHAHFYCYSCGQIYDFHAVQRSVLMDQVPDGFAVSEAQIYYKGCCEKCSLNNKKSSN